MEQFPLMRLAVLVAVLVGSVSLAEAGQARRPGPQAAAPATDPIAEAYNEFLRARLIEDDDVEGAIAAYKRAMSLDPTAGSIPTDLADLYLRENRPNDAQVMAEQALSITPTNHKAHRILGTLYATRAGGAPDSTATPRLTQEENLKKAVEHLERAIESPMVSDASLRAMLGRLYMATGAPDKAIPLFTELVKQETGWQEGPALLAEAYSAAGRAPEGVAWLEAAAPEDPRLYATLGRAYATGRRWADAAAAYELALKASPRSLDIRRSLGESLLNTDSRADALRAREVLREALTLRGTDERALYLLSGAEMAAGDFEAAEGAARRLVAQNARNAQGYSALAQALGAQNRYQPLVDALAPAIQTFRGTPGGNTALRLLLPHLGFAYQQLGQHDKAIATFEDARRISPNDPALLGYLIQAQMAAKNYTAAGELARAGRVQNPNDVRLARLESLALRRSGKVAEGLAVLEDLVRRSGDDIAVHLALAQGYVDADRGVQAVKVLQEAQGRFPDETSVVFELGSVFDRLKRPAESEAAFRQIIAKEPTNAPALNYLGYMLAERGERLGESVDLLKRALAIDPDNGSYLDSIGWAYFKDGKLDLALDNLKRAAEQLISNSVVQDHYGDVLLKLGRFEAAIGAWTQALSGDGDSIDRGEIDRKIRAARQKLPKR